MRFGGVIVVTALLLGACSSDPVPREPPPTTSSTTATPTLPVPSMPPQASEDTSAGAAAFVSHYVDVFNYAAATGDVDELSHLSDPGCTGCQKYIDLYRDTYAAGGYFKDQDWVIGAIKLQHGSSQTLVFARISSDAGTYRLSAKDKPAAGNPEKSDLTFIVARNDSGWNLMTLELQAT